jgi:TolB-like protein
MEVLVCLAQHAGEPVAKEELLQTVWSDAFVGDDVLKRSIAELRRVFEDDVKDPQFIQTIAKRGYRLIAPVKWVDRVTEEPPKPDTVRVRVARSRKLWITGSTAASAVLIFVLLGAFDFGGLRTRFRANADPQIHSLAVLPLRNLSSDPNQDYFSDGLTDELITDLAQIGSLKVISHTSTMQYKDAKKSLPEIARELNVDGVVEGTVQRSGDRVRVTAQLIYAPSDKHLWASSYDRDIGDIFALERDVAGDVAHQVQAQLTTSNQSQVVPPKPVNPKALEAYLQGNYHLQKGLMGVRDREQRTAEQYFQQAIDAAPDFTLAYVGLAESHHNLFWASSEDFDLMRRAAEKAVSLDPLSSETRQEVGVTKWEDWDWSGAEGEDRRAITLNPNNAQAHDSLGDVLDVTGRLEEGWKEKQIAQQLDPNQDHLSTELYVRGEYDRSTELLQKSLEIRPDDAINHWFLSFDYAQKGMYKEWVRELSQAIILIGFPESASRIRQAFAVSGYLGARRQEARELEHWIEKKQAYVPCLLAEVYTSLGDKDRAFYWLGHGIDHHRMAADDLNWFMVDPQLTPLHSDPRFKDLLRRAGLPL